MKKRVFIRETQKIQTNGREKNLKKQIRRLIGATLASFIMLSVLPASVFAKDPVDKSANYAGKKVAVLGDSISTFGDVSNNGAYNATIANSIPFYWPGTYGMNRADTWWQQAADILGMELVVNNSWAGSAMFQPHAGAPGAYLDRCVQLHNNAGEEPDVIWIYLGTNDYGDYLSAAIAWGTVDALNDDLITGNSDDTYTYAQPTTFLEAYAIALHKMHQRYPDAEIYCLGLIRHPALSQKTTQCNNELMKLVETLGYKYVDLENCIGTTAEDLKLCNGDDGFHPAREGMDRITLRVLSAMLNEESKGYDVSYTLFNAKAQNDVRMVLEGDSFNTKLAPTGSYNALNVIVTMGGKDVTAECYSKDGVVSIEKVTGKIYIVAWGKNAPHTHDYSKVVTAPTGTEKGYTTYTCACGDSYVSDYTDPVGPDLDAGLLGDADGSGAVDYVDAMLVLQYHTGIAGGDALDLTVCDVDGSGEVDYLDAMMILQYHTGVISAF